MNEKVPQHNPNGSTNTANITCDFNYIIKQTWRKIKTLITGH
jgi:hypothetical protein